MTTAAVTATAMDALSIPKTQKHALMRSYGRLLIPDIKIRVSAAANTKQLEKRFTYLWQGAHNILTTNSLLAHQMMYNPLVLRLFASCIAIAIASVSSLMEMARVNRVELPAAVLDFICENCGALIVPSVSADVRVQPQTHKSKANRKLTRERRKLAGQCGTSGVPHILVNVLRVSCHRCKHVNIHHGASEVIKPKSKKRPMENPVAGAEQRESKRTKTAEPQSAPESKPIHTHTKEAGVPAQKPVPEQPRSMFAPPPSPPRKLLDGPKKKKKKKAPDAAVTAVKSSLSSFLQSLRPGTSK